MRRFLDTGQRKFNACQSRKHRHNRLERGADAQEVPQIEGPYFWMIGPPENTGSADAASSGTDWLSEASKGAVTERQIATRGATEGARV